MGHILLHRLEDSASYKPFSWEPVRLDRTLLWASASVGMLSSLWVSQQWYRGSPNFLAENNEFNSRTPFEIRQPPLPHCPLMSDDATLWLIGGWVEMVTLSPFFTFPSNYITKTKLTKIYPLGFAINTPYISR